MAAGGELHLPTATFDELCSLPGMGPALARRVMEYRQSGGPLTRPEDLLAVPGVTPGLLERLRPRLRGDLAEATETGSAGGAGALGTDLTPQPPSLGRKGEPESPAQVEGAVEGEVPPQGERLAGAGGALGTDLTPQPPSLGRKGEPESSSVSGGAVEEEVPPAPGETPVSPSPPRPTFSDDEQWPRSYGGVNPAVLFGEADRAVVDRDDHRADSGIALTPTQLALLLALTAILGAALSVAAIYGLNRTLYFVPSHEWQRTVVEPLATVQTESAALSERAALLEGALAALQEGSAAVDDRVTVLEEAKAGVEALSGEIAALREQVTTVEGRVDRFGDFLQSLNSALQEVFP